jgi:uncharacterized protein
VGQPAETVCRQYEAFIAGDWDALFALFHPDVEADLSRSGIPDLGIYRGHDGLRRGWSRWQGVWERYALEVEDLIECGDQVIGLTRVEARSKGHGIETSFTAADLFTVRDGLIVRFAQYLDRDAARQAAGF